jgi:hypothetical protein
MSHSAGLTLSRRIWLVAALTFAAGALALVLSRSSRGIDRPLYDFAEYWAAGRLLARGENPYDPRLVGQLEAAAGRDSEPLLMWNPPWVLPLVLPFGSLAPRPALWLWTVLSFAIIFGAADVAWREFEGPRDRRGIAWFLAFSFVPVVLTLYLGQIAALPFAGAVLFLRFVNRRQDALAGAATLLLAVKPHLFSLFWIALLLWSMSRQRWRVLAGAVGASLLATLFVLVLDPNVFAQYREMMVDSPPAQYRSPTFGTVIRMFFGEDRFGLQFLALIPGILWFIPQWLRHRADWIWNERLPGLLFASLLTASYGAWPFDLVVLLVPGLKVAAGFARVGRTSPVPVGIFVAANVLAAAFLIGRVDFFWWIWLTPALLLAYATAVRCPAPVAAPSAEAAGELVPCR